MKSTIYYFSATGNSLEIARQISKELDNCTIKSMTTKLPEEPVGGPDESIGFVFPVFTIWICHFLWNNLLKNLIFSLEPFVLQLQIMQDTKVML